MDIVGFRGFGGFVFFVSLGIVRDMGRVIGGGRVFVDRLIRVLFR